MKDLDPNDTIAIGFQVQYQLGEGKGLAFSSCVDASADASVINAALDKLVIAAERQSARIKLPQLRKQLERLLVVHDRAKQDIYRLDQETGMQEQAWEQQYKESGRRGAFKLAPQQINTINKLKADRENAKITYSRHEEEIKYIQDEIDELERLILAVPSAANSNSGLPNG